MVRLGFAARLMPDADDGWPCTNPAYARTQLVHEASLCTGLVYSGGDKRDFIIDQTAGSQIRISPLPGTP